MKLEPLPNSTVVDDAIGLYPKAQKSLILVITRKMKKRRII
jgi:hypothetical protein